jgi:hypothetical protein
VGKLGLVLRIWWMEEPGALLMFKSRMHAFVRDTISWYFYHCVRLGGSRVGEVSAGDGRVDL